MKIKEIMSSGPQFIPSNATLQEAAQKMADLDCGFLPVGEGDKLVGTITDRDITIRAVAKGLAPSANVTEAMSDRVLYCAENDSAEEIAQNMAENEVRRLVVLSDRKAKRLTGIVSLCDIVNARSTDPTTVQQLVKGVSAPSAKNRKTKQAA